VGDEELIEIIGKRKNVERLKKKLKKMFDGVEEIIINEDKNIINGID
jgi:hypothetical protein